MMPARGFRDGENRTQVVDEPAKARSQSVILSPHRTPKVDPSCEEHLFVIG